jgi:RNA polymerase sigma-70 factor, ECF subfamily
VPSPDSETSLVERAVERDRAAFTALYELHVERVFRHVCYQVADRTDAEDITQDVFVKAWKSIHKYRWTGAPFVAWLITIARNAVTDYYRSRKNTRRLDEVPEPESGDNPASAVEAAFARNEVRMAVNRLKGDQQAVIMMRFIDGLSYEEIARAIGKSEGAVRVIQHRALKELKKIVDRDAHV